MIKENIKKQILTTIILLTVLPFAISGQTNVSGGIYSNTTWARVNSPYVVTATVAVFPGVTLTIEPGVVVKFNSGCSLWIKSGGFLSAEGTSNDSITFTCNSLTPSVGFWDCINMDHSGNGSKFNYCNIKYSDKGINWNTGLEPVRNTKFSFNAYGIYYSNALLDNCDFYKNTYGSYAATKIINSNIIKNTYGIYGHSTIINCAIDSNIVYGINYDSGGIDTIMNCMIRYNGIGIDMKYGTINITKNSIENNNIGLILEPSAYNQLVTCNKLCNNSTYDLKYLHTTGNNTVANNYWCTTDSTTIAAHIYDGYDNINYSLVSFMPIDISQCYLTTGVLNSEIKNYSFNIYPNPASDHLTIVLPTGVAKTETRIFNMLGELEYLSSETKQNTDLDISNLPNGIYIIQISIEGITSRHKFIKK